MINPLKLTLFTQTETTHTWIYIQSSYLPNQSTNEEDLNSTLSKNPIQGLNLIHFNFLI